jgi:hypothetical protein
MIGRASDNGLVMMDTRVTNLVEEADSRRVFEVPVTSYRGRPQLGPNRILVQRVSISARVMMAGFWYGTVCYRHSLGRAENGNAIGFCCKVHCGSGTHDAAPNYEKAVRVSHVISGVDR